MLHHESDSLVAGLETLACDLISERKNQPFLERLFARRKGAWTRVSDLCAGLESFTASWKMIAKALEGKLFVVWLDDPGSPPRGGGTLVLFFLEKSYWSKAAFVNRKVLLHSAEKPKKPRAKR